MRKPAISAKQNIWGNWNIYISGQKEEAGCNEYHATEKLLEYLATGKYTLSVRSGISQAALDAHVARQARMSAYLEIQQKRKELA